MDSLRAVWQFLRENLLVALLIELVVCVWRCRWRIVMSLLAVAFVLGALGFFVAWYKYNLFRPLPQQLANDTLEEYFKYGSIGTEEEQGVPFHIWLVLPRMFPEYLPKDADGKSKTGGYLAFGTAWEPGRETPVGFSRRTIGIPRVGITCALCHTATYRTSPDGEPAIVPTGPSQRFDLQAYIRFMNDCASDPRFNAENVLYEMEYNVPKVSLIDKLLYRYLIIPQTRNALLEQKERFAWMEQHERPDWGPGRIDPFNPVKFDERRLNIKDDGTIGNSDMMPIWKLDTRPDYLHWDGLNNDVTDVVLMGAIGDGATNKSLPHAELTKLEVYLREKSPPPYPFPDNVNTDLVSRGQAIYEELCADCHELGGARTGAVIPLKEIGTDRHRADMWTEEAKNNYSRFSDGYPWDFEHLANKEGYVAVTLEGLWLRAPYLHNGSVPSLEDLFKPADERPGGFYRGYDVYDRDQVGFITSPESEQARRHGFHYDVGQPGNSNLGHEGEEYGTNLNEEDKQALIEYLKTL
jgi:hypothetical protein